MSKSPGSSSQGGDKPARRPKLFMKQKPMFRVCFALTPIAIAGVYFFGWRVLGLLAVCTLAGIVTEYVMARNRKAPVSSAVFVTCMLYTLSLPPTMPFWMAAVGVVVGILFGKEVFGGFGRNFANPAIVGRAFVYVCFPAEMTGQFVPAFQKFPGGFAHWSFRSLESAPSWMAEKGLELADAVTAATPGWARRDFGYEGTPVTQLVLGNIGGTFRTEFDTHVLAGGSIGEVSAVLIILAGIYLIWTKTSNWRLTLSTLAAASATVLLYHNVLGYESCPPLKFAVLGGALLYGAVFMVTDPVSAPKRKPAQWGYGALIGFLVVTLRWQGQFAGALSFSILLGNLSGPLMDMGAAEWARRKRERAKARKAAEQATSEPGDAEQELRSAEGTQPPEPVDESKVEGPDDDSEGERG